MAHLIAQHFALDKRLGKHYGWRIGTHTREIKQVNNTSELGKILMELGRDLAYAQRDGKSLVPAQLEAQARIQNYFQNYFAKPCDSDPGDEQP